MVSLAGADAAQSIAAEIHKLQGASTALGSAVAAGANVWQIKIDYYVSGVSNTFILQDDVGTGGSAQVLNGLKSLIDSKITAQTNTLGAIV